MKGRQNLVTLYVVPDCPLCANARLLLDDLGIEFVERNVANDFGALRAMYKMTRQSLVPVVERDGRSIVRPEHEKLRDFLK